jgi:flagellar FliL protein
MADVQEKTTLTKPPEAGGGAAEPKKSGGMKKMLMLGGGGLLAIVIGVMLAVLVLKPMMSGSPSSATNDTKEPVSHEPAKVEKTAVESHGDAAQGKDEHGTSSHTTAGGTIIYTIRDIIVNPAGTGGSRFLSASFGFELASSKIEGEFVNREAAVRDALITILASKTVAQLTDPREKEITRFQIRKRLSDMLHSEEILGVYFTDFVLQ